jgi:hypothetical protein
MSDYNTIDETVERLANELGKHLAAHLQKLLEVFVKAEGCNPPMSGHWE